MLRQNIQIQNHLHTQFPCLSKLMSQHWYTIFTQVHCLFNFPYVSFSAAFFSRIRSRTWYIYFSHLFLPLSLVTIFQSSDLKSTGQVLGLSYLALSLFVFIIVLHCLVHKYVGLLYLLRNLLLHSITPCPQQFSYVWSLSDPNNPRPAIFWWPLQPCYFYLWTSDSIAVIASVRLSNVLLHSVPTCLLIGSVDTFIAIHLVKN